MEIEGVKILESEIIKKIMTKFDRNSQIIGDDCAVISDLPQNSDLIVSQDTLNENIHFKSVFFTPQELAYKALAANISDIAGMGGKPFGFFLSLSLPKKLSENFIENFIIGLHKASRFFKVKLLGGDTSSSEKISISITILGACKKGRAIKRSGAKDGDLIFVTGNLGNSAFGLNLLLGKYKIDEASQKKFIAAHLKPLPKTKFAEELGEAGIAASMTDISDGLFEDLGHILESSKKGAFIFEESIPMDKKLKDFCERRKINPGKFYNYGEDYELLFTTPPHNLLKLFELANRERVKITNIGRITSRKKILILKNKNIPLPDKSFFSHF